MIEKANILTSPSALQGESWLAPSGIRIGTPYLTTLGIENMQEFADLFVDCLQKHDATKLNEYVHATAPRLYKKFLGEAEFA